MAVPPSDLEKLVGSKVGDPLAVGQSLPPAGWFGLPEFETGEHGNVCSSDKYVHPMQFLTMILVLEHAFSHLLHSAVWPCMEYGVEASCHSLQAGSLGVAGQGDLMRAPILF
jgi:hypothetical protein